MISLRIEFNFSYSHSQVKKMQYFVLLFGFVRHSHVSIPSESSKTNIFDCELYTTIYENMVKVAALGFTLWGQ
jgi:hypothetical protein